MAVDPVEEVRRYLLEQGYNVARSRDEDYPVHVEASPDDRVRVRAEHGGEFLGHLSMASLGRTLSQHPHVVDVQRPQEPGTAGTSVYLVTLESSGN